MILILVNQEPYFEAQWFNRGGKYINIKIKKCETRNEFIGGCLRRLLLVMIVYEFTSWIGRDSRPRPRWRLLLGEGFRSI